MSDNSITAKHESKMRVKDGVIEANGIIREGREQQIAALTARAEQAELELGHRNCILDAVQADADRLVRERDGFKDRVENLKFDMNLVAAQLGITNREEVEPVVRKLLADRDMARQQIATLTAERDDFRAEIGKLAGACTVLHANNAGLERERNEALADGPDGTWICQTCGFVAHKFMLRATDMAVGIDSREVQDVCPNDGTSLRRKTWKEDALDSDRVGREQMKRADQAEQERDEARATLAQVRIHEDTMAYLQTLTITGDNIGEIRRSLFMPFDCQWNGWVRDITAQLERPILHPPAPGAER